MKDSNWTTRLCRAAALALVFAGSPSQAAAEPTAADVEAIAQSLGFISSLPSTGAVNIGIVYAEDQANGESNSARVIAMLNAGRGPNQRSLHGTSIAVKDLMHATQEFDVYLLMPGTSGQAAVINDAARRRHIVSISSDPACLEANCCVLMVSAQDRVRIVLNTALADAVGARFSSVFAMMVSRK
jgi:hypothetical protein